MDKSRLESIAQTIVAQGKGILAADESTPTIGKRFAGIGVESTEELRRWYRELLFTASGSADFIGGVICYDETFRQASADGTPLPTVLSQRGIVPGIKVDRGAKPLALFGNETVTEGLDGLRARLQEYRELGAGFAKWRGVIAITQAAPSDACILANAHALARYAALCQEAGLVPIVEPEVLMDGDHSIDRCDEVTRKVLNVTFRALYEQGVHLPGILLKPNMVISGKTASKRAGTDEVARKTLDCLLSEVPATVPGIVFLSGGQSETESTANLNAMHQQGLNLPWKLSFSYGRALQASALQAWGGEAGNREAAQAAYLNRARLNNLACFGKYAANLESSSA